MKGERKPCSPLATRPRAPSRNLTTSASRWRWTVEREQKLRSSLATETRVINLSGRQRRPHGNLPRRDERDAGRCPADAANAREISVLKSALGYSSRSGT